MPDRSQPPISGELKKIDLPTSDTSKVDGIPNLQYRKKEHNIVFLECLFESGRIAETIPGISWYAAKMLMEGTLRSSASQLADKIESLGSYIEISAGIDFVSVKLYSLTKNLDPSLEILREILTEPSFPEKEFDILKNIRIRNLENILAKNSQFASLTFSEKLFGAEHPYGRIMLPDHVEKISLEEANSYYSERLFHRPRIIVGGNFSDEWINTVSKLLNKIKIKPYNLPDYSFSPEQENSFDIRRDHSTQASIRIGNKTVPKDDPIIHDLSIANVLLGGFFGSRLMKSVREEKGLSYGIYSSINHQEYASYRVIMAEIQSKKKSEALEAIYTEIKKLAENPPSDRELKTLKNYLFGKMQSSMDSMFSILSLQKELFIHNLDEKYLDAYQNRLKSISGKEISEIIADNYLSQEDLTVIVS